MDFEPELCNKRDMMRLRDFASIAAVLSDREIDELQGAIDERREARAGGKDAAAATSAEVPETAVGWEWPATG
jgi:hypothetical protein